MLCRYDFAASCVREGLICLKLAVLKLIICLTFFMCFLKVRLESRVTPRNLNWGTSFSSRGVGWGGGGMAWGGRGVAWGGSR